MPLVGQIPNGIQRILCAGRIETCQRFIEQQDARSHGKYSSQSNFLFFAAREIECLRDRRSEIFKKANASSTR